MSGLADLIPSFVVYRCADCPACICCDCFCSGVSLGEHEAGHRYRVADCLLLPLFCKEWTAQEELMLLEGIEKYGLGNWKIITEYINASTCLSIPSSGGR